jgi:hypothetical protein
LRRLSARQSRFTEEEAFGRIPFAEPIFRAIRFVARHRDDERGVCHCGDKVFQVK